MTQKEVQFCVEGGIKSALQPNNAEKKKDSTNGSVFLVKEQNADALTPTKNFLKTTFPIITGVATLYLAEFYMKNVFKSKSINFPVPLFLMTTFFLGLIGIDSLSSKSSESVVKFFLPSLAFIKTMLPIFFVPPLVVLPLKYHLISGKLAPLLTFILLGMISSLLSSAYLSETLKNIFKSKPWKKQYGSTRRYVGDSSDTNSATIKQASFELPEPSAPLAIMILSVLLNKFGSQSLKLFSMKSFGISSTLFSFLFSKKVIPKSLSNIFHPIILCAILTGLLQQGFGLLSGLTTRSVLLNYFSPVLLGPGNILSSMLGPAVISFGLQLYIYRNMLFTNSIRVMFTTIFSALFGLFSSAGIARMIGFNTLESALSPLTRCITTPLALAGAKLTGADPSLTAFIVVLTGIFGATFSDNILSKSKINDPISVGLSVGASSHGIGCSTLVHDDVKFASSVVSMSLTGLWTVFFMSNPILRNLLINIAKPV
jgi:putative effector of murein hydrolase/putative effector of murein hydrolase LrgA (UPF0299 family)